MEIDTMANAKPVTAKAETSADIDPRVAEILNHPSRPSDAGMQNVGPTSEGVSEEIVMNGIKFIRTNR